MLPLVPLTTGSGINDETSLSKLLSCGFRPFFSMASVCIQREAVLTDEKENYSEGNRRQLWPNWSSQMVVFSKVTRTQKFQWNCKVFTFVHLEVQLSLRQLILRKKQLCRLHETSTKILVVSCVNPSWMILCYSTVHSPSRDSDFLYWLCVRKKRRRRQCWTGTELILDRKSVV